MSAEAEALEARARDAIAAFRLEAALELLAQARALREAGPDAGGPALIWTLSLTIEALSRRGRAADAVAAARLGEARLALRRRVLAEAPEELARSLREQARLWRFEDAPLDPARIAALEREARALTEAER